ncbi:MAG: SHOCT domain-containing protein [Mycobacterium sp.]
MMFWDDHDMGWWGWAGMGVGMVLFWALIIAGIVALVAYINGDRQDRQIPPQPTSTSPEQVLAARFARGEINETEYRERLAVLRDHAHR